jgi:phage protein D
MYFAEQSRALGHLYVPACTVELGSPGQDMLTAHGFAATSVSVDLALSMSGTFSFSIPDTFDPERSEFLTRNNDRAFDVLKPGKRVWIRMGYGDRAAQSLLMSGYITSVATGFAEGGSPTLEVSGMDATYRMGLGNQIEQMEQATVQDMVTRIAGENGLRASVAGIRGAPTTLGPNMESDLAYLARLAAEFSTGSEKFEFYARATKTADELYFGPRQMKSEPVATLTWGMDLLGFRPEIALGEQVSKIIVLAWDGVAREKITGVATREPGDSDGKSGGSALKEAIGKEVIFHIRQPVKSQKEADDLAASELAKRAQSYVGGSGETFGLPRLLPDTRVTLAGIGKPFARTFYVSKTVHQFDGSGYRTRFTVERTAL